MSSFLEEVKEFTGTHVPYEVFRKFYKGVRRTDGSYRLQLPDDPAHLNAIAEFLSASEDLPSFKVSSLIETVSDRTTAAHLKLFFDKGSQDERLASPRSLEGKFIELIQEVDKSTRISLFLYEISESGIGEAKLIRETFYHDGVGGHFEDASPDKVATQTGWIIVTPEDNLFVFTKNDVTGRNLCYFSLGYNDTVFDGEALEFVAFLEHEFPFELDATRLNEVEASLRIEFLQRAKSLIRVLHRPKFAQPTENMV